MGLVTTYEQLLALRFCLGIFEAGLFPGLNLYLTGWYRREEINRRASVFFAGAVLAGAFGGIFGCKCHTLRSSLAVFRETVSVGIAVSDPQSL